jgi:aspartate-semialdehyde dehydrogenase
MMHVALLGATGAVGRTMLRVLEERALPVERLTLLASPRSRGEQVPWRGGTLEVGVPEPGSFRGVDFALFSAGGDRSLEWAPRAADEGAVVVDNSSAWRMDPSVPLVVPEVNAAAARTHPRGIIANPNCSTIQLVLPLEALRRVAGLTRVVVTTFQSVSGAGETGRSALRSELGGAERGEGSPFVAAIAGNVIPQIGAFDAEGWSGEERKMMAETRKILGLPGLQVAATCVRVPVDVSHAVQATVETESDLDADAAIDALRSFPGIVVGTGAGFATPRQAAGRDEVFVARVRRDPDRPRTLHLWIVADNLRKGAATNAVQIVEALADG